MTVVIRSYTYSLSEHILKQTRSSAVADGPRDVHVIVKFSYVVTNTEYV